MNCVYNGTKVVFGCLVITRTFPEGSLIRDVTEKPRSYTPDSAAYSADSFAFSSFFLFSFSAAPPTEGVDGSNALPVIRSVQMGECDWSCGAL